MSDALLEWLSACSDVLAPVRGMCVSKPLEAGGLIRTRMWANAQRDGRPAERRWRPLFNAAKFG